jgi:hypothetical protein
MGQTAIRQCAVTMFSVISLGLPAAAAAQTASPRDQAPPRLLIEDVFTRNAARRAVSGASEWLANPKCLAVFSEFRDERGRPLTEKLGELGVDPRTYLGLVLFRDAGEGGQCADEGTLALTTPRSRVVYLCGSGFARSWRRDASESKATIIHEMLHSLGLGENPPSSLDISHRVLQLCRP